LGFLLFLPAGKVKKRGSTPLRRVVLVHVLVVVEEIAVVQCRSFVALVLLVGLGTPALGQETTLKWNFQKGKAFYQEMTTDTKQTMQVMGMEITQNQKQTFIFSWTPQDQKDGNWVIKQKIEGVKMDIEIGGNKISFDSTKDTGAANPLSDFFKALVGSEFTLTLSPKMTVTDIKGRQEFVDKLIKANQQMEPLLKQILSEQALKQMADPTFAILKTNDKGPAPVKKGDTWERTSQLDMGPIGKYDTTYKYTYEGKEGNSKLDKISVATTLTYTAPGENSPGGLPFKIKSADLKSKDGTGTILFDNDKGRLASSEMNLKLNGKLSIEIGGMTTDVTLDQTQKTTVRTSDDNPAKKAG
jgi:hypothetical protein